MDDIKILIWLFPILFIFHDFEEIILMKPWINRNSRYLSERFPVISKRLLTHFESITTASFSFGVAEEFLIISIVTVISYLTNWYLFWLGLFIAFTVHLMIHIFQTVIIRKYVPAIVTSILCLPVCCYIIMHTVNMFSINSVILYSIFSVVIMIINLGIVHKLMNKVSNLLKEYEQNI